MKKTIISLSLILLVSFCLTGQKQIKYYRLDFVKTIKGKITEITKEKSYYKKDFTVIYLNEKKSGKIYRLEVAPDWFFKMDMMKGSYIEVTGSYRNNNNLNTIMTQSIIYGGENFQFRDKNGFPLWRGRGKYFKKEMKAGRRMKSRGHY